MCGESYAHRACAPPVHASAPVLLIQGLCLCPPAPHPPLLTRHSPRFHSATCSLHCPFHICPLDLAASTLGARWKLPWPCSVSSPVSYAFVPILHWWEDSWIYRKVGEVLVIEWVLLYPSASFPHVISRDHGTSATAKNLATISYTPDCIWIS